MKPKICVTLTTPNVDWRGLDGADLVELRIDLIGPTWRRLAKSCPKPWIACNRSRDQGGAWQGSEEKRLRELLEAAEMGAEIADIEITASNLRDQVQRLRERGAECLISHHDFNRTPSIEELRKIVERELEAGASVCKAVTFANKFQDNLTTLRLVAELSLNTRVVCFAMGRLGWVSRIISPLVGADFTYAAAIGAAAPGQLEADKMVAIYQVIEGASQR